MRREPQQQRSEQMVERILAASLKLLSESGIERLTTRHIADKTGISVGTLYHYFKNKQEITAALEAQFMQQLQQNLLTASPLIVQKDIGSAVRDVAQIYLNLLTEGGGHWAVLLRLLSGRGLVLTEQIERPLIALAMQYLSHHPELAHMQDFPKVMYIVLNSCAFNLIRHSEKPPAGIDSQALIDGLADMATAYVQSQMPNKTTT
ncbi:MAG: TetR/AcrR family transcriptional regulator [Oceanococcus sp.]